MAYSLREDALNSTKWFSYPAFKQYIKNILDKNPDIQTVINNKLKNPNTTSNASNNLRKFKSIAEAAKEKVVKLEAELSRAKKNAENAESKISNIHNINAPNNIELPIIYKETYTYPAMDSINLLKVSPLFKDLVDNTFIIDDYDMFDKEWFAQSEKYIHDLSLLDRITVLGYTFEGDVYINTYLRDPNNFINNTKIHTLLKDDLKIIFDYSNTNNIPIRGLPFYSQLFTNNKNKYSNDINTYFNTIDTFTNPIGHINNTGIKVINSIITSLGINKETPIKDALTKLLPYIKQFGEDLSRIIKAGPKVNKAMKVYRGIKKDYITAPINSIGFTSTTISYYVAEKRFSNYNNDRNIRTLYELIITQDIPCIWLPPKQTWPGKSGRPEFEVLIDTNIKMTPSNIKFRVRFAPALNKNLLQSFINYRNYGEEFKTRTIELSKGISGGKRTINKTHRYVHKYKPMKYTKKRKY